MNKDIICEWLQTVWRLRPGGFFNTKSMLILDSIKAHKTTKVLELMAKNQIIPATIPGGLTKKLQQLDISINKPFKSHMRQLWRDWMALDNHTYTKIGRVRRASYAQICSRVSISWGKITIYSCFLHSIIQAISLFENELYLAFSNT